MNYGVPKEVRELEKRVGLTPAGVHALVGYGHTVYVEQNAGEGAGFTDENYRTVGAEIVYSAEEAWGRADVVAKVSRLTEQEYPLLRAGTNAPDVHPSRGGFQRSGRRAPGAFHYGNRVRDDPGRRWFAAGAGLLERSRRTARACHRRRVSREHPRRTRYSVERRAGRAAGRRRHPGRRHIGNECGARLFGYGRSSHRARPRSAETSADRRNVWRLRDHTLFDGLTI